MKYIASFLLCLLCCLLLIGNDHAYQCNLITVSQAEFHFVCGMILFFVLPCIPFIGGEEK